MTQDLPELEAKRSYTLRGTAEQLREHLVAQTVWLGRTRAKMFAIGLLVIVSAGVAWVALVHSDLPVPLGAAALVAAAIGLAIGLNLARRPRETRKLDKIVRFLDLIGVDTPSDAPLTVEVDLADGTTGPWLGISGELADGNTYALRVRETAKRKTRRKRRYTKIRERLVERVELRLSLRLGADRLGPQTLSAIQQTAPPPPLSVSQVRLNGRTLVARLRCRPVVRRRGRSGWEEDEVAPLVADSLGRTLLWAYEGLRRAAQPPQSTHA